MRDELILSGAQCDVLDRVAEWAVQGGIGGFKNVQQAKATMVLALAEGIPIGKAIHEYHVIQGRLALKSEAMLARFQNAGGRIEYTEYSDQKVTAIVSHPKGGSLTVSWSMADARRAGLLTNSTWMKHPRPMLKARAVSEGVRAVYPACLSGVPVEEEAIELAQTLTPPDTQLETLPYPTPEQSPEPPPFATAGSYAEESLGAHPLDAALAHLDQQKLHAFLIARGQIRECQTYRDLSPEYARRVLERLPSFLRSAGFSDDSSPQPHCGTEPHRNTY